MNKLYKKIVIGILVVALVLVNAIYFTLLDVNALEEVKVEEVVEVVELEEKKDLYSKVPNVEEKLENIKIEVKEAREKEALEKAVSDSVKETVELTVEERIKVKCDEYGVPYDLALAIARLETGWFKSNAFKNKNNVGGMMWKGKLMEFDSLDEGVDRFVKNLHKNYISCGLKTPEKIGSKYCPVDDGWIRSVKSLMKKGE